MGSDTTEGRSQLDGAERVDLEVSPELPRGETGRVRGELTDCQTWLRAGSHWLSGRDEGLAVAGAFGDRSWFRTGEGNGPGEQGGVASKPWETVVLGF